MTRLILVSAVALLLSGCASTYEPPPAPAEHPGSPGNPADPHTAEMEYQPSATLTQYDPIDPLPVPAEFPVKQIEPLDVHQHPSHTAHADPPPAAPAPHVHTPAEPPATTQTEPEHDHVATVEPEVSDDSGAHFTQALRAYLQASDALANEDLDAAREAIRDATQALAQINMDSLNEPERGSWKRLSPSLESGMTRFVDAPDIWAGRTAFRSISNDMKDVVQAFGAGGLRPVYVVHCPMAFAGQGVDWLQNVKQVNNPYYGSRMLRCGSVTETLISDDATPEPDQPAPAEPRHH